MKNLIIAFQFLTRFQITNTFFEEGVLSRSSIFFPVVGLFLGAVLAGLQTASSLLFPPAVTAALLLVGMVIMTGGIHLDGFMDSVDGLFSGRPREEKLRIMKDSRVGALGVAGAICLLLLKFSLLLDLPTSHNWKIILLFPVLSRWGMVCSLAYFPPARIEGLARLFGIYTRKRDFVSATVITCGLASIILWPAGLFLMAWAGIVVMLLGFLISKQLGGLTGDNHGAINEILEVAVLFMAYPLLKAGWL